MRLRKETLTAGITTEADWNAVKVVERYQQDGEDVGSKEGADIAELGSYFISFEILKE